MTHVPELTLNHGITVPQLGFGVFLVAGDDVADAVTVALDTGYRLIDTASSYRNEEGVGEALAKSGLARDEYFVTTKLGNADHGYDEARAALDASLARLGLEYVDLYLIHWPVPSRDRYVETWRAFERARAEGQTRAIGVSNFTEAHLERLAGETDTVPAVNQIELHPYLDQEALRRYHAAHGIVTEAWSPIGRAQGLLEEPAVVSVAASHQRTAAQVVLRWHVQLGNLVIPKSVTPDRIRSNFEVFDFELSDDDMATISGLSNGHRIGPDPEVFGS